MLTRGNPNMDLLRFFMLGWEDITVFGDCVGYPRCMILFKIYVRYNKAPMSNLLLFAGQSSCRRRAPTPSTVLLESSLVSRMEPDRGSEHPQGGNS